MANFDGQLFFALIAALFLSWLASLWVTRRYVAKVLELMQTGAAPDVHAFTAAPPTKIEGTVKEEAARTGRLDRQNRLAVWRLRMVFVLVSAVLAIIIAIVAMAAYVQDSFGWRRLVLLSLVYAWPIAPGIGLLERWPRWKISVASLAYMLLAGALVMLNSTDTQKAGSVLFWLFGQQIPLLVFIFIMTGPKLRPVGPYLMIVFFLLTTSSLLGLSALAQAVEEGPASWVADLAAETNAYVVFILFTIVPWFLAFYPVRGLARRLAQLYRDKVFSDPIYLFSGVWLISLVFQAMVLSHSLGFLAYGLVGAWISIPAAVILMKGFLRPQHRPPMLLLLRVFRGDDSVEALFDSVVERWRYSGNTVMIAGSDLALRNIEPDELFTFLSGRVQDRFISGEFRLNQALQELDEGADPDGRFRVNEFFCFDSTWKWVLETLVDEAGLVLMDLREYTPERKGCSHELQVLASKSHLQKVIVLMDRHSDKKTAEQLLAGSQSKIVWIESEKSSKVLQNQVLSALLTP